MASAAPGSPTRAIAGIACAATARKRGDASDARVVGIAAAGAAGRAAEGAVAGAAGAGATALTRAQALRPAVILLDLETPGLDGIATVAALCRGVPESAVVLHSLHDGEATQARARAAGAAAFVS